MGTRNLTAVMMDKEYKIAQYGQWDGYPEGQGRTILNFIHKTDLNAFKEALKDVRWITEDESKKVVGTPDWPNVYPHLSRDAGGEILQMVMDGTAKILTNSISFAGDSIFCEYAYVIDLDKNTFEVYEGFNKKAVKEGRFTSDDKSLDVETKERAAKMGRKRYHPVVIVKEYSLDNLPTEAQFLEDLKQDDEDGK